MSIFGIGKETYLLVSGLLVLKEISLTENLTILPVTIEPDIESVLFKLDNYLDLGITMLGFSSLKSQLRVRANNSKNLAIHAWNSQWDLILISAIFKCEIGSNLQSSDQFEKINSSTIFSVTNYHLKELVIRRCFTISETDEQWLTKHYKNARNLIDQDAFETAVHSLASYRWHSHPRVQLAVLWSGLESIFNVNAEISFRVSLYIANFLHPNDKNQAYETYEIVKKLYSSRSSAVHGGKIKGDQEILVQNTFDLLHRVVIKCIENNSLPNLNELIFN